MALGLECQKFTGPGKDGSEEECPGGRASPAPPEPRPARRVFAKDCPEKVRGRGLPGRGPYPGSGAVSSPRLCPAGGRTRARAGRRDTPQEAGLRLSAGFDPGSPELATRGRLSPNPCHLSSLGWQHSPGTGPGYSSRRFSRPEVLGGWGGTPDAQTASPVRRRRTGTKCRRGCEPGASSARAQPAVPWSPGGEGGESGRDPSLEAAAASRADCRARQPAGGLGRAPVGLGWVGLGCAALRSAARPLSRPAAAEPRCFEWERVRWGRGRYL